MAQKDLIPVTQRSEEEAKEMSRKGGIASGVARRKKKNMREQLQMLFELPIKDEKARATLKELGVEDDEMNNQMALLIAMYRKAIKGDVSAFNSLRDTSGQVITNKAEVDVSTNKTSELSSILAQLQPNETDKKKKNEKKK